MKLVKIIHTSPYSGSTNSTSYTAANSGGIVIDTSKYDNDTYYHEAILAASAGGTAYAVLRNKVDGANVSGSEISTTSTGFVRVRSAAITLDTANADRYGTEFKSSSGSYTCWYVGGRVIVMQEHASAIGNTETIFYLNIYQGIGSGTTYLEGSQYVTRLKTLDIDGTIAGKCYYTGNNQTAGQVFAARLFNVTDNQEVTNSVVTTTSQGEVSLSTGDDVAILANKVYAVQMYAANGGSMYSSIVHVRQTGSWTKTQTVHQVIGYGLGTTNSSYKFSQYDSQVVYYSTDYDAVTVAGYYHFLVTSSWGYTGTIYVRLYDLAGTTQLVESSKAFSGTGYDYTDLTGSCTPVSNTIYRIEFKRTAGSNTVYLKSADLYLLVTLEAAGTPANDARGARIKGIDTGNSARGSRITGKDTANTNRSAKITGVASTDINDYRLSKITGKDTANSSRSSKITGKSTANDFRAGHITGKDSTNSARNAKITGKASVSDQRGAKIEGQTGIVNSDRSAKITGKDSGIDARGAKLSGQAVGIDDRGARVKGQDTSTSERPAKIWGQSSEVSDRSGRIWGKDTASDSRGARITGGTGGVSDSRGAKIWGVDSISDGRNAKITGQDSANSSRPAKIYGKDSSSDERGARIWGVDSAFDSRGAKITGHETANDSRSAKISGLDQANDSRSAKIHGLDSASDSRGAKIEGGTGGVSDYRLAKITGKDTASNERPAKIIGIDSASDSRNAVITGKDTTTSSRSARTIGKDTAQDSRAAKIKGMDSASASRGVKVWGKTTIDSARAARIKGKDTADSYRNVRITGQMSSNSSRGAMIKGVRVYPYKKKTSNPYSGKDSPYSRKETHYRSL